MTALSVPNAHGVYPPSETLTLQHNRRNWRGCALAEIDLALTADGWRSAHAFQFLTASRWGSCSPIVARDPAFATREEAIAHEAAQLRARVIDYEANEVGAVLRWLASLRPAQGDLFAVAA
jgi:hypothetical protein